MIVASWCPVMLMSPRSKRVSPPGTTDPIVRRPAPHTQIDPATRNSISPAVAAVASARP
jgi:hypothetical protein